MVLSMKQHARLAALGAAGVGAGALALFALLAWVSAPTATGGIDRTQAHLSWIALAVPFAAIIAAHVVYARQLMRYAGEQQS
jgi:hypothetical protein